MTGPIREKWLNSEPSDLELLVKCVHFVVRVQIQEKKSREFSLNLLLDTKTLLILKQILNCYLHSNFDHLYFWDLDNRDWKCSIFETVRSKTNWKNTFKFHKFALRLTNRIFCSPEFRTQYFLFAFCQENSSKFLVSQNWG